MPRNAEQSSGTPFHVAASAACAVQEASTQATLAAAQRQLEGAQREQAALRLQLQGGMATAGAWRGGQAPGAGARCWQASRAGLVDAHAGMGPPHRAAKSGKPACRSRNDSACFR